MSLERINFFGKCLKDFLEDLFAEKMTLRELSSKKKMVGKIILRKKWLRKIDWGNYIQPPKMFGFWSVFIFKIRFLCAMIEM